VVCPENSCEKAPKNQKGKKRKEETSRWEEDLGFSVTSRNSASKRGLRARKNNMKENFKREVSGSKKKLWVKPKAATDHSLIENDSTGKEVGTTWGQRNLKKG